MDPLNGTPTDCFVSPDMRARIVRLAVGVELMASGVHNEVGKPETDDADALTLGLLAQLCLQVQTLLEVTAGFRTPIEVKFGPPTDDMTGPAN